MKKQTHVLVFLVNFLIYITASTISSSVALASSPWNFDVDLSYEHVDTTQKDKPKETTHELQQKYRIKHHTYLSSETREETELKATLDRETRKGTDEPNTTLYEPYAKFQLKSRWYDLGLGYKKSEEKTDSSRNTNNGFVDFKIQQEYLPELNIKYDFRGETNPDEPKMYVHNFSANSIYNVASFLKIRLDYKGEITDYQNTQETISPRGDTNEGNFIGQVTLKHFLFNNKLRFDLDYKLEKDAEKQQENDPNTNLSNWNWTTDEVTQTTTSKLTYTLIPGTVLSAHYENEDTQDKIDPDQQTDTFWLDVSQKMWSFMKILGKYKYDKDQDKTKDETTDTYEAEIKAAPQKWLNLRGKFKFESKDTNSQDENLDKKEDTQTIEGNWKAYFPQILKARNTFNVKLVKGKEDDADSTREEYYEWKLQLTPITDLRLTPEYNVSREKQYLPEESDQCTREVKTVIAYGFHLARRLKLDLSHSISEKRIKDVLNVTKNKENNDDTKFDIKFTPTQNLILSSQITIEQKKMIEQGKTTTDDVNTSYGLNYDWKFNPFTWSSSYKYDNRNHEPDTETLESKLTYKVKSYDLTTTYKYTKTYSEDNDKEHRIGLELRAYY